MGRLQELARARLTKWMDANQDTVKQKTIASAVGHGQSWVSNFRGGSQDADIDEIAAMAQVFGHTLYEVFDLRPNPREQELLDAFRAIEEPRRGQALGFVQALVRPPHGKARPRSGGR